MEALKNLADRFCSHQPALRPFDEGDWQAFNGCESDNPEIAYTARGSVILDGTTVEVVLYDEGADYDGDIHARGFSTPEEARALAEVLCANPALAPAILGESVGHT
jgi:hypothetical protein